MTYHGLAGLADEVYAQYRTSIAADHRHRQLAETVDNLVDRVNTLQAQLDYLTDCQGTEDERCT